MDLYLESNIYLKLDLKLYLKLDLMKNILQTSPDYDL